MALADARDPRRGSPRISAAFGGLGTLGGILVAASLYSDGCGPPSADEAAHGRAAAVVLLPLAMAVAGWLASRPSRRRVLRALVLAVLAVSFAILGTCLATRAAEALSLWPLAMVVFCVPLAGTVAASVAVVWSTRRAADPGRGPWLARADRLRAPHAAALGAIAVAFAEGVFAYGSGARLVPSFARAAMVAVVVAWMARLVLTIARRRLLLAAVAEVQRARVAELSRAGIEHAYRDASPATRADAPLPADAFSLELDELRADVRRDGRRLGLATIAAAVAIGGLALAPPPPERQPPPGTIDLMPLLHCAAPARTGAPTT